MKKPAFVALISVIIVSAIILTISLTLIFTNLNASLSGLIVRQSQQARALAKTCSELALLQLANNFNNTASNAYNFTEGNCEFEILTINSNTRQINSIGELKNIFRKESLEISLVNDNIEISIWQELADF